MRWDIWRGRRQSEFVRLGNEQSDKRVGGRIVFQEGYVVEDTVTLSLSRNQALVLFEWLSNLDDKECSEYDHPAEERVLWRIQGQLESTLVEPFDPDYCAILAASASGARK